MQQYIPTHKESKKAQFFYQFDPAEEERLRSLSKLTEFGDAAPLINAESKN